MAAPSFVDRMDSKRRLKTILEREQFAFLCRPRKDWAGHLVCAQDFFGAALKKADPARPVLILGAGWGLEIPWRLAPKNTTGWDADPNSRIGTLLRHFRWAPWVFDDITGGLAELDRLARRVQVLEGRWLLRPAASAAKRLSGLLLSLVPSPNALKSWISDYCPGTIICANVLGQVKPLAYRIVELAFKPRNPWIDDQDAADPMQEALDAWVAAAIRATLGVLRQSGARLYMLHDRGVIHQNADISLGEWTDPWTGQIKTGEHSLDVSDPMPGVDIIKEMLPLECRQKNRWVWTLGKDQVHVMEALAFY